LKLCFNSL